MAALLLAVLALQAPPFSHSVSRVTAAGLPHSWHRGCPVAPVSLRRVRLTYWGFDHRAHNRALIVNAKGGGSLEHRVSRALRGPLPDSAPAADRRLRRERRALARRRQHGCLQLPLRRRAGPEALVGARLRAGGGREPGREPLPRRRPRASARRACVPRPLALPARNGRSRRPARARLRGRRLAMGRALER